MTASIDQIETAAAWLADQPAGAGKVIRTLRERFALNAKQACEAIARAQDIRAERHKGGVT
ncbi:hypothetical protein [Sinorhizobium meliloti]|uniref:hypothetical protein n=1 Tax=Rhizobium meliloti TaxID=382 RepID=UPI000FD97C34|nr:hypothetical protein [Sinorhizobium meliloti]RVG89294.1 hypothetical protein CN219_02320 [Sinorhizobium meliloti]RVI33957.1 hypothetical protein CN197_16925 [Sinorhizobium meliloti]RVI45065.1 hypothetical protein CN196_13950 [Sinorhizobium meliloti]RVJ30166.1 hypothetical protein CN177_03715 [Sinorhizobium meliloti]RVK03071.1 hypothetical protein CN170_05390 [Sinorhizobium meliloti]